MPSLRDPVGNHEYRFSRIGAHLHSRDMKTQHVKFQILKQRLSLFYCNLIQNNFVLNMFSISQICKENFHPFSDVMNDVTKRLDVCHR